MLKFSYDDFISLCWWQTLFLCVYCKYTHNLAHQKAQLKISIGTLKLFELKALDWLGTKSFQNNLNCQNKIVYFSLKNIFCGNGMCLMWFKVSFVFFGIWFSKAFGWLCYCQAEGSSLGSCGILVCSVFPCLICTLCFVLQTTAFPSCSNNKRLLIFMMQNEFFFLLGFWKWHLLLGRKPIYAKKFLLNTIKYFLLYCLFMFVPTAANLVFI